MGLLVQCTWLWGFCSAWAVLPDCASLWLDQAWGVNPKYYCNWVDCEYQGEVISKDNFTSKWGYIPESDGYVVELTHFMNPKWTYEQCEEYVFKTNSKWKDNLK